MNRLAKMGHAHRAHPLQLKPIALLGLIVFHILVVGFALTRPTIVAGQDSYPAPFVPEINPIDDGSIPSDASQVYPAPTTNVMGVVGSDAEPSSLDFPPDLAVDTASAPATASQSSSGLLFLWGGFMAALLIFATAVVGSVVLFARHTEQ